MTGIGEIKTINGELVLISHASAEGINRMFAEKKFDRVAHAVARGKEKSVVFLHEGITSRERKALIRHLGCFNVQDHGDRLLVTTSIN